ncbi:MAG TPA: hypothetical protein VLC93_14585 [Myxococcota bacterium]|nr:hypothetical protein [Myxococcota bacterium]
MLGRALALGLAVALVACGGEEGPTGTIEVDGMAYGMTVTVWSVDGREQTVEAEPEGAFGVSGVRPPYDILFAGTQRKSLILGSRAAYHDVARPPPPNRTLQDLSTVSFGLTPQPPSDATTLWVVECGGEVLGSHSGDGAVDLERGFYLDAPRSCAAKVLVLNPGADGYGGRGSAQLQLQPRSHSEVAVDVSTVVTSRLVTFDVIDPNPDTTFAAVGMVWPAGSRGYAAHVIREGVFASTTVPAPESSGVGLSMIFAAASDGDALQGSVAWRALALDAGQALREVTLPSVDIIVEPATGAQFVGTFALEPRDGGIYVFVLGDVTVTTASPELTLADLSRHGIVLGSGVRTFRGYITTAASVDADLSLDGIVRQRDAVRIQSRPSTFVVD